MIDTIFFDLDGTLLHYTQDEFVSVYFGKLQAVFIELGLDPELAGKAVWAGTEAMIRNDGAELNSERFWEVFAKMMDLPAAQLEPVEAACERFYSHEFDSVRSIMKNDDLALPRRLTDTLASKGYQIVLATNPLFPTCATATRLGWVGLRLQDFCLVTDYANSRYCKPNPAYYREILDKIGKEPDQCLMIGNNTNEDLIAETLGIDTYLVTDCLENETGKDIAKFRHGTLAELETWLASAPDVEKEVVH